MSKAVAPLLQTDAYKLDHRRQYPEGTEQVFSNYTNRGSRIEGIEHVVHFGLQGFLVDLTNQFDDFFEGDIEDIVLEYENRVNSILGPNTVGSDHIRALHKLGYLPLAFGSLPEGTRVPIKVPSFTIRNTHPDFYWLVNYLETWISASVWQPSTSATLADHFKTLLVAGAEDTDQDGLAGVQFQGHDFSYRGMAGNTAAAASGAGHLLSFQGSDSLVSLEWVDQHYGAAYEQPYEGWLLGSVPATEHSVMCAGGEEDERETFARLLKLYPAGIVSVVSDTWDLWNVLTNILPDLKDEIMARDGKLVVRPDSGDPVLIITGENPTVYEAGYPVESARTPAQKGVIELLWDVFGGTVNAQGYKVLDPHIGAIYGDSITFDRAREIIRRLAAKGFASTNIVFGVGSYTYQYQTRDTFSSAIKATWVRINGEEKAISKNPITDSGTKKSARGRLVVRSSPTGDLVLVDDLSYDEWISDHDDLMKDVYRDGEFLRWQSLDDIRAVLAGK
jgi:nicotinamide phosphoribosyltransferase